MLLALLSEAVARGALPYVALILRALIVRAQAVGAASSSSSLPGQPESAFRMIQRLFSMHRQRV
jgi:hypothetical protein